MKLEHRRENLVSFPHFVVRVGRYAIYSFVLILISLAIGTTGYCSFAGLNFVDSFYMTSMILTGMGPVKEMNSVAAKLFSSFYALYSGVAFLSISAVFLAPIIHRLLHILHVEKSGEE